MGVFSPPKAPKPPPLPPPPPPAPESPKAPEAAQAGTAARKKSSNIRRSTVLTSPQGLEDTIGGQKTLLGV